MMLLPCETIESNMHFWLVVSRRYILTCCISLNLFHDLWILFDLWIRTLIIFTNIVWKFNQFLNIYVYSKISNTTLWWFIYLGKRLIQICIENVSPHLLHCLEPLPSSLNLFLFVIMNQKFDHLHKHSL